MSCAQLKARDSQRRPKTKVLLQLKTGIPGVALGRNEDSKGQVLLLAIKKPRGGFTKKKRAEHATG